MNKATLISNLRVLETDELKRIIEEDYYRQMLNCSKENTNSVIMNLIDELLEVEQTAANPTLERYDIAIICRDKRVELADQIALMDLVWKGSTRLYASTDMEQLSTAWSTNQLKERVLRLSYN